MDKSFGTNLHLWRSFTRAEQSRANSSTLVQPLPRPLQCWARVHAISPEFQHCIGGGGGGEATHFEADNRAFSKLRF